MPSNIDLVYTLAAWGHETNRAACLAPNDDKENLNFVQLRMFRWKAEPRENFQLIVFPDI